MNHQLRTTALWSLWAILPVIALAFHFGPGQPLMNQDRAVRLARAMDARFDEAAALQDAAYEAHLARLEAQRAEFEAAGQQALIAPSEELQQRIDEEAAAYAAAETAWQSAMASTEPVLEALEDGPSKDAVLIAQAHAKVRAGSVITGINDLDALLESATERNAPQATTDAIRQELAAAQYIAARLVKDEGRPPEVWRYHAAAARQHFRLLAESARDQGATAPAIRQVSTGLTEAQTHQKNLELALNLEQSDLSDRTGLGLALPRQSPRGRRPGDDRPGRGRPQPSPEPGEGPPATGSSGGRPWGGGW